MRRLPRRPAAVARARRGERAERRAGARARPRRGHRAGDARSRARGPQRDRARHLDRRCSGSSRGAPASCRCGPSWATRATSRSTSATSTCASCRCRRSSCSAAPRAARGLFASARRASPPGRAARVRDRHRRRPFDALGRRARALAGPAGARRALYVSRPLSVRVARRESIRIERERVVLPGDERRAAALARHGRARRRSSSTRSPSGQLWREAERRPGLRRRADPDDRRDRRARGQRGGDAPCLSVSRCGVLRALPRPDEHLRRPRQPARARAPLRVARDRLRADASGLGEPLDGERHDLYYIGGGQDRDQRLCAEDLLALKAERAAGRRPRASAIVLGVCGGYQLLGRSYTLDEERIEGVGLLDVETVRDAGRAPDRQRRDRAARAFRRTGEVLAGLREPRRAHRARRRPGAARPRPARATATTAAAASRARAAATRSAPTCTARCCRRTSGSRTG